MLSDLKFQNNRRINEGDIKAQSWRIEKKLRNLKIFRIVRSRLEAEDLNL